MGQGGHEMFRLGAGRGGYHRANGSNSVYGAHVFGPGRDDCAAIEEIAADKPSHSGQFLNPYASYIKRPRF